MDENSDAFVWIGDRLTRVSIDDSHHPHYGQTFINGHWYRPIGAGLTMLVRETGSVSPAWRRLEREALERRHDG